MILEPIEVREIVGLPGMDDAAESMESVESVESFREWLQNAWFGSLLALYRFHKHPNLKGQQNVTLAIRYEDINKRQNKALRKKKRMSNHA